MKNNSAIIVSCAILALSHLNSYAMVDYNHNPMSISELNGEARTINCPGHSWDYITITSGSVVYYNYRCANCEVLRYDTWKKK